MFNRNIFSHFKSTFVKQPNLTLCHFNISHPDKLPKCPLGKFPVSWQFATKIPQTWKSHPSTTGQPQPTPQFFKNFPRKDARDSFYPPYRDIWPPFETSYRSGTSSFIKSSRRDPPSFVNPSIVTTLGQDLPPSSVTNYRPSTPSV